MIDVDLSTRAFRPSVEAILASPMSAYAIDFIEKWWPGRELNPRHADFQSAALPTELPGPEKCGIRQAAPPIVNSTFRINHLRGLPVYGAEPSMAFPSLINAMFGQRLS